MNYCQTSNVTWKKNQVSSLFSSYAIRIIIIITGADIKIQLLYKGFLNLNNVMCRAFADKAVTELVISQDRCK